MKKYFPIMAHFAAVVVLFMNASVQAAATAHPAYAATVLAVWGVVLAWAKSPKG